MGVIQKIYLNKTIINGGLFSIYSFFQRGIGFILLIIFASYISPNEYGKLSLFNTAVMFVSYFTGLNTAGYLSISYFANKNFTEFKKDFTTIYLLIIGCLIIFLGIIIPFKNYLSTILSITPLQIFIAIIIATCTTVSDMILNYFRVQEKIVSYGVYACSLTIINATITLILVIVLNQSWYGYIESNIFTKLLYASIATILFYKWRLFHFKELDINRFKKIINWGVPLIPHLASIWIRQGMDRYIIEHNHTTADVGLFSFALNLVSIIIMIGSSFNNSFSVNIYKTLSLKISGKEKLNKLKYQGRKIMLVYIIATILILTSVLIFVPIIMHQYKQSLIYFVILSIYGLLQCFYFQYCNYFFYYKQTPKLMYITLGTSLLHLITSLILTPYSLIYTCITYVLVQIIIILLVKKGATKLIQNNIL